MCRLLRTIVYTARNRLFPDEIELWAYLLILSDLTSKGPLNSLENLVPGKLVANSKTNQTYEFGDNSNSRSMVKVVVEVG